MTIDKSTCEDTSHTTSGLEELRETHQRLAKELGTETLRDAKEVHDGQDELIRVKNAYKELCYVLY